MVAWTEGQALSLEQAVAAAASPELRVACCNSELPLHLLLRQSMNCVGSTLLPLTFSFPPLPTLLSTSSLWIVAKLLKSKVNNGAAPGPSGWTGSHLQLIAESENAKAIEGLTLLVKDLCNGVFTGAMQQRLLASLLIPISKGEGRGVRPIAMGETFVKLAAHYTMSLRATSGSALPSHSIRRQATRRLRDCRSAHSSLSRSIRSSACRHHRSEDGLRQRIQQRQSQPSLEGAAGGQANGADLEDVPLGLLRRFASTRLRR